jgi:hypothetical protein
MAETTRWCFVSDLDPFADAAFLSRLQKLLSLIGSGQQAEAEAARRKLLEHLSSHRLSLTDLAIRLGQPNRPERPHTSFTQGAREMQLERQLGIARAAKHEAESEFSLAMMRLAELQSVLHQANIDMGRLIGGHARMRTITGIACGVAAICLCVAVLEYVPGGSTPKPATISLLREGPMTLQSQGAAPGLPARQRATEYRGTVAVQDLAVRLNPSDDAGVRAFLISGEPVYIEQQVRVGGQNWLLIRSESGSGWVRSGDILH